jgi:metal-sulfur cluster biosynthetic enzyme
MSDETEKIRSLLKEVIDPELMVNIVDLGLVYAIQHNPIAKTLMVNLTLSSVGCPLGDVIMEHVQYILESHYPGYAIHLTLVWEPAWNKDMVTAEGKVALGW